MYGLQVILYWGDEFRCGWVKQHGHGGLQATVAAHILCLLHPSCCIHIGRKSSLEKLKNTPHILSVLNHGPVIHSCHFNSKLNWLNCLCKVNTATPHLNTPSPPTLPTPRSPNCSASCLFWSTRHPSSNYCLSGLWGSSSIFSLEEFCFAKNGLGDAFIANENAQSLLGYNKTFLMVAVWAFF